MSSAEEALESAIIVALNGDADVVELLGDAVRSLEATSPKPACPYLEIARHLSEWAGAAGVEAD